MMRFRSSALQNGEAWPKFLCVKNGAILDSHVARASPTVKLANLEPEFMTSTRREQLSKEIRTRAEDGREVVVYEYVTVTHTTFHNAPPQVSKGTRRYALRDGSSVNRVDKDTFEVVQTGETLRKI